MPNQNSRPEGTIQHSYEGLSVLQMQGDGLVSLTNLWRAAKSANDEKGVATTTPSQWLRYKSIRSFVRAVEVKGQNDYNHSGSNSAGFRALKRVNGGPIWHRGTWAVREIAIRYAMDINDDLGIWAVNTLLAVIDGEPLPEPNAEVQDILARFKRPTPATWEVRYTPEWWDEACRVTGLGFRDRRMGKFINKAVYAYMPPAVAEHLRAERLAHGTKLHQSLSDEGVKALLLPHLDLTRVLMRASADEAQFFHLLEQTVTQAYQQRMFS